MQLSRVICILNVRPSNSFLHSYWMIFFCIPSQFAKKKLRKYIVHIFGLASYLPSKGKKGRDPILCRVGGGLCPPLPSHTRRWCYGDGFVPYMEIEIHFCPKKDASIIIGSGNLPFILCRFSRNFF